MLMAGRPRRGAKNRNFARLASANAESFLSVLTDPAKDIPRPRAGIAFVDRAAQGGQPLPRAFLLLAVVLLALILFLLALQGPQTGADDLARVFVAPALYLRSHKTVKFLESD